MNFSSFIQLCRLMVTAVVMTGLVVACQKKNDDVAAPPPPPAPTVATCNPQAYSPYAPYGFTGYPYGSDGCAGTYSSPPSFYGYYSYTSSYTGFCNCPYGTRPTFNGTLGLGCVNISYFQPYLVGAFYYGYQPNNNQWVSIPQISNISGYPENSSCYNSVALSCWVDQPSNCGAYSICQPTVAGSRIGICVRK